MLSAHTGAPPALPAPRLARLALRARRRGRAARPGRAPSAARSRPRAARSAPWRGRCAPRRRHVFSPITCARCLLVVGTTKTSCAARCSRRSVQLGLRVLPRARVGRGGPDIMMRKRAGGTPCVLPHSMCNASRRDAPLERERLPPRPGRSPALSTLSARAPRHTQCRRHMIGAS